MWHVSWIIPFFSPFSPTTHRCYNTSGKSLNDGKSSEVLDEKVFFDGNCEKKEKKLLLFSITVQVFFTLENLIIWKKEKLIVSDFSTHCSSLELSALLCIGYIVHAVLSLSCQLSHRVDFQLLMRFFCSHAKKKEKLFCFLDNNELITSGVGEKNCHDFFHRILRRP